MAVHEPGLAPPQIKTIESTQLVGVHAQMTLAEDATPMLWRSFMPRRGEVVGRTSDTYLSLRRYTAFGPEMFAPDTPFEKWAAVAVHDDSPVPEGMQKLRLPAGQYAVFIHHGPASAFESTMQYIFVQWLPESKYELDVRPQFEVLEEGYDPLDVNAQEEVWIPIRPRVEVE